MWDMKPEYGSVLFILLLILNETSDKHGDVVVYKDVLNFPGNCFLSHMSCNCPALASTAVAEGELLKKNLRASMLDSNGDKEKAEESGGAFCACVLGFFFFNLFSFN